MKNKLSKEAQFFLQYCWRGENQNVIILTVDKKEGDEKTQYKVTEELIQELQNCDRVKVWSGGKKNYNVMGLKGRHKE